MALFFGIILILCTIALLILAMRQHKKVSEDKPYDDIDRQIDFDDFIDTSSSLTVSDL